MRRADRSPFRACAVHVLGTWGAVPPVLCIFFFFCKNPTRILPIWRNTLFDSLSSDTFFPPCDLLLHWLFPLLWGPVTWAVCLIVHHQESSPGLSSLWALAYSAIAGWSTDVFTIQLGMLTGFWTKTRLNPRHLSLAGSLVYSFQLHAPVRKHSAVSWWLLSLELSPMAAVPEAVT